MNYMVHNNKNKVYKANYRGGIWQTIYFRYYSDTQRVICGEFTWWRRWSFISIFCNTCQDQPHLIQTSIFNRKYLFSFYLFCFWCFEDWFFFVSLLQYNTCI